MSLRLFITSPGRCGSSLLAEFCRRMGYDPGGDWCEVTASGREVQAVREIQGQLMTGLTADAQIRTLRHTVVKDCLLFRHPRLLDAWLEAIPDLSIVGTWRDPEAQWRSWGRKLTLEGFPGRWEKDHPLAEYCKRVEQERADFNTACSKRRVPIRWITYPDFCDQLPTVIRAISPPLLINRRRAGQVWGDLIDASKIHFRETPCTSPASAQPTAVPA